MAIERALIVDDSKSARVMLCRLLEKKGLKVDLVESADDSYEHLASNVHPDVIFMDHMMPGTDGLTATRRISKETNTRSIPIVMYTSKEDPAYLEEALSAGAVGVLPKPAKPSTVDSVLSAVGESVAKAERAPEPVVREVSRTMEPVAASVDIVPKKSVLNSEPELPVETVTAESEQSAAAVQEAAVVVQSSSAKGLPSAVESEAFWASISKKVRELVYDSVNTMLESKLNAFRTETAKQLQKTTSSEMELYVQKLRKGVEEQIAQQIAQQVEAAIAEVESKTAQAPDSAADPGANNGDNNKEDNVVGISDDVASSIRQSAENAAKLAASEIATNAAGSVANSVIEQQIPAITKEVLRELKTNADLIAAVSGSIDRPTMEPTVKAMEAEMAEMRKQLWELDAAVSADQGSSHDHPELRTSISESKSDLRGSIKSAQVVSFVGAFLAGVAIVMQLLQGVL